MYFLRDEKGKVINLPNKVAKSLYGLRREGGITTFLPHKLVEAIEKRKISGSVVIGYESDQKKKKRSGTCVIRIGGIGDLILLSSSLHKLKKKNPGKPLVLATVPQHVKIFKNLSCLDDCITIKEAEKYSFDRTIDLRYAVEPDKIAPQRGKLPWKEYITKDRSDVFDSLCGVNSSKKFFEIPVRESKINKIKGLVGANRPLVGFTPTCYAMHRCFPADYVEPIAKKLVSELKATVVLFGKTESWNKFLRKIKIPGVINLIDKTDQEEAIALCSLADAVISPDTGFIHVAGALSKKCVALFGNINPKTRTAYYPTVKPVYSQKMDVLGCQPCWDLHEGCKTHKNASPCMRLLRPEIVLGETRRVLNA